MSQIPKIVPWASTAEYMDVAECLYSPDLLQRKRGIAIVKAWRARSRIPVAIEATANLVEMTIADTEQVQRVSANQLRHMYTMSLIRFVNSIVDLEQKGLYAQSIAALAARIGMPAWFVELRHAGTHEYIPSLPVLRSACSQALLWLGDYYWQKQTRALPEDTQVHIRHAIARYIAARNALGPDYTETQRGPGPLDQTPAHQELSAATTNLSQLVFSLHSDAVRLYLVPVLIESGFLVPEEKKLRARFPDCRLALEFVSRWDFIFSMFCDTWGRTLFFEELVSGIAAALIPDSADLGIFGASDNGLSTSHAATLVAWIRWILENSFSSQNGSDDENDQDSSEFISIDDVLEDCLRNPGYYSRAVLKVISDVDPVLKKELKPFVDYMGKALAALVAIEAGNKGKASKEKPCVTEKALQEEEAVLRKRLESLVGRKPYSSGIADGQAKSSDKTDDEPTGMEIDNHATSVNTPSTGNSSASAKLTAHKMDACNVIEMASDRWSLVPLSSWSISPIGTNTDGSVPSLEWPTWLDEVPPQIR
ncbi:rRNA-processing protein las1 [Coemansia sp. RSA 1813]|nr:rRNA-processing protein las1 [Coemansia sp. RSA 1843]KAJ2090431.1 rRNA-processing protein las1 [Coemansia sp. RSA 986]KAJ2215398.1 rRNA-processing protein las1 [Coemansia sp. RSA 487]KAJ2569987.1 rRNA-processing protein las1 [Coemansia sp. RSA 1813]